VAVASTGPYASLHPAPDRQPRRPITVSDDVCPASMMDGVATTDVSHFLDLCIILIEVTAAPFRLAITCTCVNSRPQEREQMSISSHNPSENAASHSVTRSNKLPIVENCANAHYYFVYWAACRLAAYCECCYLASTAFWL